jgi:hypothetical protein
MAKVRAIQIDMKTKKMTEISIDRMEYDPEITPYKVRIDGKVLDASTLYKTTKTGNKVSTEVIRLLGTPSELRSKWSKDSDKHKRINTKDKKEDSADTSI